MNPHIRMFICPSRHGHKVLVKYAKVCGTKEYIIYIIKYCNYYYYNYLTGGI